MLNFGIEYELERTSADYRPPGWRAEFDGTLRDNGLEFVFEGKQNISTSKARVRQLLDNIGSNFSVSHRCSTHIHVDTQGLNGYSRVAMLLGLVIHDRWFFQYGNGRELNSFCTPVLYNPNVLAAINRTVRTRNYHRSGQQMSSLPENRDITCIADYNMKYMSINTMPVQDWGSIELRHFAPIMNADDMDTILDKIAEIYTVASNVGNRGKLDASRVWTGYDSTLTEEINWVQEMYALHNNMVGT